MVCDPVVCIWFVKNPGQIPNVHRGLRVQFPATRASEGRLAHFPENQAQPQPERSPHTNRGAGKMSRSPARERVTSALNFSPGRRMIRGATGQLPHCRQMAMPQAAGAISLV